MGSASATVLTVLYSVFVIGWLLLRWAVPADGAFVSFLGILFFVLPGLFILGLANTVLVLKHWTENKNTLKKTTLLFFYIAPFCIAMADMGFLVPFVVWLTGIVL